MKIRVLPEAAARIEAARAWWAENRDKAPDLLDQELTDAFETLTTAAKSGQRVALSRGRSVRRMLLPKTAFHLYYEVVDDEVHVLTFWGAVKGTGLSLG